MSGFETVDGVPGLLRSALDHQKAGRVAEAEALYRQVLDRQPDQPDANHMLGVLALEAGDAETAVDLIGRTTAATPEFAEAHVNLGNALQALGRPAAAIDAYRHAIAIDPDLAQAHCNRGLVLVEKGDVARAEEALATAVAIDPTLADAHYALATLRRRAGRLEDAVTAFEDAVAARPGDASIHHDLGITLSRLGRLDEAEAAFRRAIRVQPDHGVAYFNLANTLHARGRYDDAVRTFEQAIEIVPDHAEALNNLGCAWLALDRPEQAIEAFDRGLAVARQPADLFNNRGNALRALGRPGEAVDAFRRAVEARPGFAQAFNNLGNAARDLGFLDEATQAHRRAVDLQPQHAPAHYNLGLTLAAAGDAAAAADAYRRALDLDPGLVAGRNNLGNALRALGRPEDAVAELGRALEAKPDFAEAACNLGSALQEAGEAERAIDAFGRAIRIQPGLAEAHSNLGRALHELGRMDEAIASYRRALALRPDLAAVRSNLLLALNYATGVDEKTIFAEHLAYDANHAAALATSVRPRPDDRDPEGRLRIGYVSPDFRLHAIASFIMPAFIHRRRDRFELHCYYTHHLSDPVTEAFRGVADGWTDAATMSDDDLAAAVRRDRIDILVDLAGHSAFNRLLVFARRPAPVQVTWIGYSNTTGLAAMDYRLTDAYYDPEGESEDLYTETLVRLPTRLCFQPPADCPEVGPLPARDSGHVTFVSMATLMKVNAPLLALWARILAAVPGSRLVMMNAASPDAAERVRKAFADGGVDPERLVLEGRLPYADHMELHNRVDIGLDAYPFNGGTTSYTAAWMGVPHVTLCGRRPCSRHGRQLFGNLGLDDLVTETADDYVDRAVALAGDIAGLEELRRSLRPRMAASPVTDGAAQTRALEDAYRRMWVKALADSDA